MNEFLNRRRFLAALAASVVAAGVPLPVGFPHNKLNYTTIGIDPGGLESTVVVQWIKGTATTELINIKTLEITKSNNFHSSFV